MTARSQKQMHSFLIIAYDNPNHCCYFRGNYTDFKLVFDLSSVQGPQQSYLCFGIDKTALFVIQSFNSNSADAKLQNYKSKTNVCYRL